VIRYMNTNYYLVKLNAETGERLTYQGRQYSNAQFAQALGISGYPTMAFFKPDGGIITTVSSYFPTEKFLPIARYFGGGDYKTMTWDAYAKKNNVKLN
jgi:thioredoxin-related protein